MLQGSRRAGARTAAAQSWRTRWLLAPRSDVVAAALLGVAMFSKPTQIMLIAPLLVSAVLRRQWWRGLKIGGVFAAVAVGLFVVNTAVTGEWNYQGGDRKTFYGAGGVNFRGGFPLQTDQTTFETVGLGREGGGLLIDVLLTRDALLEVFPHNLGYFMFGRHTGFAIYFFPGVMAVLLFLAATRDRAMWQWLTFAAGVGSAVVLLLYMPFTYSGGGGPVGNRYFLGSYGVFLFLVPPLQTAVGGLVAMAISSRVRRANSVESLFRFDASVRAQQDRPLSLAADGIDDGERPADQYGTQLANPSAAWRHAAGLRVFHRRQHLQPRGRRVLGARASRAPTSCCARPLRPRRTRPASRRATSLHIEKLTAILESGPKPNRVVISTGGDRRIIDMAPSSQQTIELEMPHGMPYRYDPRYPTNYVYSVTISSSTGFVPMFENGAPDSRFLGVMVRLIPTYGDGQ